MKKLLILILIIVVGKVMGEKLLQQYAEKSTAQKLTQIATEINQKLPMTTDFLRLEKVEYADHVMRFSGTLMNQSLSEEAKSHAQQQLKSLYCSNTALRAAKVRVEYVFSKLSVASIHDKVHVESWTVSVRPEDCG